MIEGLDNLLEETAQPGLAELRQVLEEILGGPASRGQVIETSRLLARHPRVHRLRFVVNGWVRSVVAKRMEPATAERNQLALRRWLPAVGLGDHCPILLGNAAERNGQCIWHVYDDLGDRALDAARADHDYVRAVVEFLALLHTRFASHPLLAECRQLGGNLGVHSYATTLRDAICCLEALRPDAIELSADQSALRDRLLDRLHQFQIEQPTRMQALTELGGPETLVHGNLRTANTFVLPSPHGVHARFIDWDHTGVGLISCDLSTLLSGFASEQRLWILDVYREAVQRAGWVLPSTRDLDFLLETAELARFANCTIWPAIALVHDHAGWGFDELAKVDEWFASRAPILPDERRFRPERLAPR
jgi:hypothetical protein